MLRLALMVSVVVCAACTEIGLESFVPNGRIVGGTNADIRQYPHQISIHNDGIYRCGGSIYAANIIISAAHCVIDTDPKLLKIGAGSTVLSEKKWELAVIEYIMHDKYNRLNYDYDVAILVLRGAFPFNEFVQPIPLAKELVPAGTEVIAIGWGALIENGSTPDHLQLVRVNILDPAVCREVYGSNFTSHMLCAGVKDGAKDACQGDSGGPLIVNNQLLGVVSWGEGCGKKNFPGVYASVPDMYEWIVENAEANRLKVEKDNYFFSFLLFLQFLIILYLLL